MKTNKFNDNRISRVLQQAVSLAVVFSLLAGIVLFTPTKAEAAASQFDQTFGSGGKVFYSTVSGSNGNGDIEIQPDDGKAVVVGMNGFEVARFNVNGTPDNTFDGDGLAQVPSLSQSNALAIQTDGKIVVAGRSGEDMALARFNSNGSLDTTFDGDGIVVLVLPDPQEIFDIAIQPDGKIIVGGNTGTFAMVQDFMVVRFNANGTPDASFGPTGIGVIQASFNAIDDLKSVALQTDGKIVAGGSTGGTDSGDFALLRITPTGSLDTTFDTDGKLTTSMRLQDLLSKVLIQPDGKIIATGNTSELIQGNSDVAVIRYNPNGSLDTSFDVDGIATTNDSASDEATAAALQPDGKIIVTERRNFFTAALIRFNSNGSLDTSFHGDGICIFPASNFPSPFPRAVAIQSDGKIIISGQQGPDIFLSRLLGDPRQSFTNFNGIFPADRTTNANPPGVPSNYPSIADINGASGTITKVRVTLTTVTHTFPGDFDVLLVGPQGQRTILMSDTGGGNPGVTARTYIFDQSAAADFPTSTAVSGIYKPFNGDGPANIEPGAIDVFPAPGPGSANYGAANLDVFNGTNPNGIWKLYVVDDEAGDVGSIGNYTLEVTTTTSRLNNLTADYDGDGKTDISIFRPSNGQWWRQSSFTNQITAATFGLNTDKIAPADFTGDGKTDIAFWRPSGGLWFILRSEDNTFFAFPFGTNGDVPQPADYDGDGRADAAVYRQETQTWYISNSSGGTTIQQFGASGDIPATADYDGDGRSDIGIYRPNGANGAEWWHQRSSTGITFATQFGLSTDKPVQADYTGDGKADIAFWRPSNGNWFILRSEDLSFFAFPLGANGDRPAPGDYDGDGKADAAVFRPSDTTWYISKSTGGTQIQQFGIAGDLPTPSAFIP